MTMVGVVGCCTPQPSKPAPNKAGAEFQRFRKIKGGCRFDLKRPASAVQFRPSALFLSITYKPHSYRKGTLWSHLPLFATFAKSAERANCTAVVTVQKHLKLN
jgi:hypothetical protein